MKVFGGIDKLNPCVNLHTADASQFPPPPETPLFTLLVYLERGHNSVRLDSSYIPR